MGWVALLAAMIAFCDTMGVAELRSGEGEAGDSGLRKGEARCGDAKEKGL